jgi:hypothetical protein
MTLRELSTIFRQVSPADVAGALSLFIALFAALSVLT